MYGPNTDSPNFYNNINKLNDDIGNDTFIICGDFNLDLEPEMHCKNYININNPKSRTKALESWSWTI